MSAEATLRPLLGELGPRDEESILAALRDDGVVESAAKFRETKLYARAAPGHKKAKAREREAEMLNQRAELTEHNAATSVSILKNAQTVASSLAKVGVMGV